MKIRFRIDVRQIGAQPSDDPSVTIATRPTQPTNSQATLTGEKGREIKRILESVHTISNRFWLKNGSYRKQSSKPFLTRSRFAIKDFQIFTILRAQACQKSRESTRSSVLYETRESNPSASLAKCKSI
jgi:hypothetical protein